MSWKGFVKAVSRMPQQVMAKAGYAEETIDEEFNTMCSDFDELEQNTQRLQEDATKYKSAVNAMLEHQESFATTLLEVYAPISGRLMSPDGEQSMQRAPTPPESMAAVQEYVNLLSSARETIVPELNVIERRVINPANDFLVVFKNIRKTITKRNHKLLDYDRHRNDVHKLEIATNKDAKDERRLAQTRQQFEVASQEFAVLNDALKQQLPHFLQLRIAFIDPCFQSLYFLQLKVYRTMTQLLEVMRKYPVYDMQSPVLERYNARKQHAEQLIDAITVLKYKPMTGTLSAAGSQEVGQLPGYGTLPPADTGRASSPPGYAQPVAGGGFGPTEKGGYGRANSPTVGPSQSPQLGAPSSSSSTSYSVPVSGVAAAGAAAAASGAQFNPFAGASSSAAAATQHHPGAKYVMALYDYEAQAPDDLSFHADDRIEVLEASDNVNDWWKGRIGERTGYFPANYVAQI
ncbi:BAR adaptor protein Hob1 [Sorochytrium milnesiophthora]